MMWALGNHRGVGCQAPYTHWLYTLGGVSRSSHPPTNQCRMGPGRRTVRDIATPPRYCCLWRFPRRFAHAGTCVFPRRRRGERAELEVWTMHLVKARQTLRQLKTLRSQITAGYPIEKPPEFRTTIVFPNHVTQHTPDAPWKTPPWPSHWPLTSTTPIG